MKAFHINVATPSNTLVDVGSDKQVMTFLSMMCSPGDKVYKS